MLLPDKKGNLKNVSHAGNNVKFSDSDLGVANWVFVIKKSAGYSTDTLSSSKWYYLPLNAYGSSLGVLAIAPNEAEITNEQRHLIESFTGIVSIALANYILETEKT